jgi:hypothetical protein
MWATQFRDTEPERRELAAALNHVSSVSVHARVESGGAAWPLVEEKGKWHLDDIGGTSVGLPTPAATLTALLRAFETHSLDGAMALLAEPLRGALRHELEDRAKALRELLQQRRSFSGTNRHLRVVYGRYHVDLVNQDGTWLIEDLN